MASYRGSKLESDSCPDNVHISEMERRSRVGVTRPLAGRHVQGGSTESDGCRPNPVQQTIPTTEQNRESKTQVGYTGNNPVGGFSWLHAMAQQAQGRGMENLMTERTTFGSGSTSVDPMTFYSPSSMPRRTFGSGTTANPVTFERQSSPEQRPFGSGTTANPVTFERQSSPEQRQFGSKTPANPMTFERQSSPEQRPFGSRTPANPMTYERQSSPEQRPFGSGTFVDQMTYERQASPEQRPFGSGTFVDQMTYARQASPEQRPFGSGTFVNQMTYERQASPEQRPFGSGTFVEQMTYERQLSPEQRPFGIGTFVDQMAVNRQLSREQRAFDSGTFADPMTVAMQSLLEQRAFFNGTILSRSTQEQRTSSMLSAQLGEDDVMEDRDESDEDSRRSFIATSMENLSIEDNDVSLPEQATASVDPALFVQDEDGDTYLHMAIISERIDHALCLIHLAPDSLWLDRTNKLNQTPLHLATFRRQPKVIRRLLHRGAKRVVHDLRGNTPLHIACSNGHLECVHELTSSDPAASVMTCDDLGFNQSNYEGQTCLHLAAAKNQLDVIRYLVDDCGININQKELRRGCTILHRAVATSNLTLLDYLLSLPAAAELIIDEPTYDGYTALHLARLTKQTHVEQMLLSAGAHPVTYDYWPSPEVEM